MSATTTAEVATPRRTTFVPRAVRRIVRRPVAVGAIAVIVMIYGMGLLAPLIAPHGFNETDLLRKKRGTELGLPAGDGRSRSRSAVASHLVGADDGVCVGGDAG